MRPETIDPHRPLVSLGAIEASARIVAERREPDKIDVLAELKQRAEIDTIEQGNRNHEANRDLRTRYAKAVYWYLIGYSVCSFALLLASGFKPLGFSLPDAVLSLVVGSTAVAAIGLVGFVVQGLFKASS